MSEPSTAGNRSPQAGLRNYILVTAAYWSDTVTDGATRMLVLFYFYNLGYTPLAVASLFIFYEVFGIVTNLFGGYIGARFGLTTTLFIGLGTQLGSGCTSGHGICGLSNGATRSLAATLVFMAAAMLTVFVVRHVVPA